jgi:hypothetical protein
MVKHGEIERAKRRWLDKKTSPVLVFYRDPYTFRVQVLYNKSSYSSSKSYYSRSVGITGCIFN